jgi:predicted enzyme related to lactoylglutathione lyase
MSLDLFAGIYVSDHGTARAWYERLLGSEPAFDASDTESVWELAEHRYVFIEENVDRPERVGRSAHTIFVDDLDGTVAAIAARGIAPIQQETYGNGVRKTTFRDPDGNEIGFGGAPIDPVDR